MANVMSQKNVRNNVSRNGFDLSQNIKFTANPGELLPVYTKILMPGDSVKLRSSVFTRTIPLNTAAYLRLREEINFFVVPIHQLWSSADTFFAQMKNNPQHAASALSARNVSDNTPYINVNSCVGRVFSNSFTTDILGKNNAKQTCKLLQLLGYGDYTRFIARESDTYQAVLSRAGAFLDYSFNPFPLLAYQKIYSDYYRFQQWEKAHPEYFNIDYASNELLVQNVLSGTATPSSSVQNDMGMFALRYANYPKDMLFGILPSPQYGDESLIPVVQGSIHYDSGTASKTDPLTIDSSTSIPNNALRITHDGGRVIVSNPSIIALRKAEALQKLREIQLSGNQDYKTQIEKIFNVTMSDDMSDLSTWIGGFDSSISINEVVNNNLTGEADANIQGKGIGNSSSDFITYDSKDWCVLMGIYTCRPELDYSMDVMTPDVTSTHIDHFPNPVLDKVGNESVRLFTYAGPFAEYQPDNNWLSDSAAKQFVTAPYELNTVVGYAPRYYNWKISYDRVCGDFRNLLRSWVAPFDLDRLKKAAIVGSSIYVNYGTFKVDASLLDSVFVSSGSDKLLVDLNVTAPIVRNLDYDGLPY